MQTVTLISDSLTPCGVESFARGLAHHLGRRDGAGQHETCPITGQPGEMLVLLRAMAGRDALIVNLPMVAWKQRIAAPARAMLACRRAGHDVILVLHEWADLDWKRRLTYLSYVPFASRLLFSSPLVQAQFEADLATRLATGNRALVPIPPNLAYPAKLPVTEIAQRISAIKAMGKLIIGHFGSIYPKKQPTEVLEIAARLKADGQPVHCVFIGSFIGGATLDIRALFKVRAESLGLADDVLVTGYIGPSAEVFAAIEACDVLVYHLAEGLTSRRGSVLACLQTGRPLVVNGPVAGSRGGSTAKAEFAHHPAFLEALASGGLILLDPDADADAFALAIRELPDTGPLAPRVTFARAWADVLAVVAEPAKAGCVHTRVVAAPVLQP